MRAHLQLVQWRCPNQLIAGFGRPGYVRVRETPCRGSMLLALRCRDLFDLRGPVGIVTRGDVPPEHANATCVEVCVGTRLVGACLGGLHQLRLHLGFVCALASLWIPPMRWRVMNPMSVLLPDGQYSPQLCAHGPFLRSASPPVPTPTRTRRGTAGHGERDKTRRGIRTLVAGYPSNRISRPWDRSAGPGMDGHRGFRTPSPRAPRGRS